jgi:hypothetical protein
MRVKAKRRLEVKVGIVQRPPLLPNTGPKNSPNKKKVYSQPLLRKKRRSRRFSIRNNSRVY